MENGRRDPRTLIALFFRIVDVPHRTLAAAVLMSLMLTALSLGRFPVAELVRNGTLWGGGVCIAGQAGCGGASPDLLTLPAPASSLAHAAPVATLAWLVFNRRNATAG